MSTAFSVSVPHLPICKYQEHAKESLLRCISRENPNQKTLYVHTSRRNLLKSTGLGLIGGGLSMVQPTRAEPESPQDAASSRMSYSRFLQYVDEGAVKKVDLFENGTIAVAEIFNPALNKIQRVKIQLPGLPPELLRKLKEKDIDFAAHPKEVNLGLVILDLLGNLAFPLILLGSLFLRSSSMNTPGGPNLPFGLGR